VLDLSGPLANRSAWAEGQEAMDPRARQSRETPQRAAVGAGETSSRLANLASRGHSRRERVQPRSQPANRRRRAGRKSRAREHEGAIWKLLQGSPWEFPSLYFVLRRSRPAVRAPSTPASEIANAIGGKRFAQRRRRFGPFRLRVARIVCHIAGGVSFEKSNHEVDARSLQPGRLTRTSSNYAASVGRRALR
jgi:hypothetical protein